MKHRALKRGYAWSAALVLAGAVIGRGGLFIDPARGVETPASAAPVFQAASAQQAPSAPDKPSTVSTSAAVAPARQHVLVTTDARP